MVFSYYSLKRLIFLIPVIIVKKGIEGELDLISQILILKIPLPVGVFLNEVLDILDILEPMLGLILKKKL